MTVRQAITNALRDPLNKGWASDLLQILCALAIVGIAVGTTYAIRSLG